MAALDSLEPLLPQQRPMLLLDGLIHCDQTSVETEVVIRHDTEFCVAGKVGAWLGLEYMAQTLAAFAAERSRGLAGARPVGLLLGSRRYSSTTSHFAVGDVLRIRAREIVLASAGASVVRCEIVLHPDAQLLCQGELTLYAVADLQAWLQQQGETLAAP